MLFHASVKNKENKEYPIEKEGARVLTTLNINFSDIQGLLTLQSFMGYGRVSKSE